MISTTGVRESALGEPRQPRLVPHMCHALGAITAGRTTVQPLERQATDLPAVKCRPCLALGFCEDGRQEATALRFPCFCAYGEEPMTSGRGDEMAAGAAGRGRLRASHADREQVIGMLKAAFVQGRVTKDELDMRVGQTLASRTYADLAAVTADLPAGLARTQPVRKPARAKARPAASVAAILCPAGIFAQAGLVHAVFTGNDRLVIAFIMPAFISLVAWVVAGVMMADTWHQKGSRGELPPPSAQRGPALDGERGGGTGDDLILCEVNNDVCACQVPGHRVIQRTWRSLTARRDQRRPASLQVTA
jgi:Domain of unknown function (DUF1707)